VRLRGFLILVVLLLAATAGPALAQNDKREVRARQLFGVGKYAEALEIFGNLYAETLHPTYLRNVGRCYQNLGEPDKAISSFSEYLRQAKNLPPVQRQQVEGYIHEMEELKRKRQEESAAKEATRAPPPRLTASDPEGGAAARPRSRSLVAKDPDATSSAQGSADQDSSPFYTRWWFWTVTAAVVAGGVATVIVLRSGAQEPDTTFGTMAAHPR
jgi:tetratricopeptide (TPR) repeat protein